MIAAKVMQFTGAIIFVLCASDLPHARPADFDEIVSCTPSWTDYQYAFPVRPMGYNRLVTTQSASQAVASYLPIPSEKISMKMPSALRAAVLALAAFAGVTLSSAVRADEGF